MRRVSARALTAVLVALAGGTNGCALGREAVDPPARPPDLQGNWTNATLTPLERPRGMPATLTRREAAQWEASHANAATRLNAQSDPDRSPPPHGGLWTGNDLLDSASGGTGGYNYVWLDGGDRVAVIGGEHRTSILTRPANGRIPPMTLQGRERLAALQAAQGRFGEFDNPENRPLSERCLTSIGSNLGPPMLPNYFYNNNYTIVQTVDYLVILSEMVHDVRIIPIVEEGHLPRAPQVSDAAWFGVSVGYWQRDTLVVETTGISPQQLNPTVDIYPLFPGGSEQFRVVERFARPNHATLHYEFTVIDPATYTQEWGGEVPFRRLDALLYEYACNENNYSLANVLSGARYQESRLDDAARPNSVKNDPIDRPE